MCVRSEEREREREEKNFIILSSEREALNILCVVSRKKKLKILFYAKIFQFTFEFFFFVTQLTNSLSASTLLLCLIAEHMERCVYRANARTIGSLALLLNTSTKSIFFCLFITQQRMCLIPANLF